MAQPGDDRRLPLGLAAQVANTRIIDAPTRKGMISPNRRRIWMIAMILGLVIPGALLSLFELLNNKIHTEKDVKKYTSAPFLGAIGQHRPGRLQRP